MDFTPVAFTTILVAIAGPVGITLGWWLGKRSEHDRMAREERKSAYVAFVTAAILFRRTSLAVMPTRPTAEGGLMSDAAAIGRAANEAVVERMRQV